MADNQQRISSADKSDSAYDFPPMKSSVEVDESTTESFAALRLNEEGAAVGGDMTKAQLGPGHGSQGGATKKDSYSNQADAVGNISPAHDKMVPANRIRGNMTVSIDKGVCKEIFEQIAAQTAGLQHGQTFDNKNNEGTINHAPVVQLNDNRHIDNRIYNGPLLDALDGPVVTDASIPELREKYKDRLDSPRRITAEDIDCIYKKIGHHWRVLGRQLGIDDGELDNIDYQKRFEGPNEMSYELLHTWIQREADDATVSKLTNAILAVEMDKSQYKCKILNRLEP